MEMDKTEQIRELLEILDSDDLDESLMGIQLWEKSGTRTR